MNKLFYGDNLEVLRKYVRDESVDLCYIDPPFNSKRNYNQIYNNVGREDVAQAQAFMDTWTWNDHANECLAEIMENKNGVQTAQSIALIEGLGKVLGKGSLFAYLVIMTVRIAEIQRSLKPTGSFYLHCDPTASHYLKLMCDALIVSRGGDYKNEISWKRNSAHSDAVGYGRIRDVILFYTMSDKSTWNDIYQKYDDGYVETYYRYEDADGRNWRCPQTTMERLHDEGKVYYTKNGVARRKRYLDEAKGMPAQDSWSDIQALRSWHQEKLGYPTQKPEALLERIISASSNEGDVVLDAFCGCGTTIAVAQRLKRRWIGIDITYQSISLIMKRLKKIKNAAELVEMHGIPRDMESVRALVHKHDDRVRKEFEKWAVLTFSDNHAMINEKRGADRGIDGVAYTVTGRDDKGNLASSPVIFSVKSGKIGRKEMAELRGTIEREKAAAGILITLENPTKPMLTEAKQAGQFKGDFATFDRLQIVTVQDILDNKRMNLPLYGEVLKNAKTDSGAKQPSLYE